MFETLIIIGSIVIALIVLLALWPLRIRVWMSPEVAQVRVSYFLLRSRIDFVKGEQSLRIAGIPVASGKLKSDKPKPEKEPRPKRAKTDRESPGQPPGPSHGKVLWAHRDLMRTIILKLVRLMGRLIRSWKLDYGKVALVLGLGDPAKTGMATGYVYAALPVIQQMLPKWTIVFIPEFRRGQIAAEFDCSLRLLPIEPVYHVLRTLGTMPWRRLWKLKAAFSQP